jgi:AcrR family transcriptional regulator
MASQEQKAQTRKDVLVAACKVARRDGLYTMKVRDVADEANVSHGTVLFHFEVMDKLRTAVVKHTIETHAYLDVLAQALTRGDYHAVRAPAGLKREALKTAA